MDEIISSLREQLSAFQQGEEIVGVPVELAREVKRVYWDGSLKQEEYAERLGITVWQLRKFLYKRRFRKESEAPARTSLVPVKVVKVKEVERAILVKSPSGFRIELSTMTEAVRFLRLVEAR